MTVMGQDTLGLLPFYINPTYVLSLLINNWTESTHSKYIRLLDNFDMRPEI